MSRKTKTYAEQSTAIEERRNALRLLAELQQTLRKDCPQTLYRPVSALVELYQASIKGESSLSDSGFLWMGNIWLRLIRSRQEKESHKQTLYAQLLEMACMRLRTLESRAIKDAQCRIYCMCFRHFLDNKPVPERPLYDRDMIIGPEDFLRLTKAFVRGGPMLVDGKAGIAA